MLSEWFLKCRCTLLRACCCNLEFESEISILNIHKDKRPGENFSSLRAAAKTSTMSLERDWMRLDKGTISGFDGEFLVDLDVCCLRLSLADHSFSQDDWKSLPLLLEGPLGFRQPFLIPTWISARLEACMFYCLMIYSVFYSVFLLFFASTGRLLNVRPC